MRTLLRRKVFAAIMGALLVGVFAVYFLAQGTGKQEEPPISGQKILAMIEQQLGYGPRHLGAPGREKLQQFLLAEMQALTDEAVAQSWDYIGTDGKNYELTNIIGRLHPAKEKRIILATHYDSKRFADKDAKRQDQPVPGANDSASGVAVLVELARKLHKNPTKPDVGIDFVFFDGEEGDPLQGNHYNNWKPLGSTYFAERLDELYGSSKPSSALVLDMVCDKNLNIYKERSSVQYAPDQVEMFWNIAREVDGRAFNEQKGQHIKDDHTPLNQAGIPSFLVIDFDYPPFHTTEDTLDKCSAESLGTVASATFEYLYSIR